MRPPLFALLAVATFGMPALAAAPVFSAGARAGVHWPVQSAVTVGPLLGVGADAAVHPNVSLGGSAEASRHSVTDRAGKTHEVTRAAGGFYARYRLDVMRVMPFAEASLAAQWLQVAGFAPSMTVGAGIGFGLTVPLWHHLYVEPIVRYGYLLESGRFPAGATVEIGVGWRSGAL